MTTYNIAQMERKNFGSIDIQTRILDDGRAVVYRSLHCIQASNRNSCRQQTRVFINKFFWNYIWTYLTILGPATILSANIVVTNRTFTEDR